MGGSGAATGRRGGEAVHPALGVKRQRVVVNIHKGERDILAMTGGKPEQAAQLLGIGERTLYRKLKEYGLR